jgi:hypothetical protein
LTIGFSNDFKHFTNDSTLGLYSAVGVVGQGYLNVMEVRGRLNIHHLIEKNTLNNMATTKQIIQFFDS